MKYPHVQVQGPPLQRGRQYGQQAADRIGKSLQIYAQAFEQRGVSETRVDELATRFLGVVRQRDPDAADELSGIASGAGVAVQQIVAINARTELLYWQDEGCTSLACTPAVTESGHTLIAQNWDWRPECVDNTIVLQAVCEDGLEFITLAEAGTLARSGLSSRGVAVAGNFLSSDRDFSGAGIPIPFIRRAILRSAGVPEVIALIRSAPRAFSSNHLVADASGRVADCETAPDALYLLEPEGGLLTHSNQFRSARATAELEDTGIQRLPDTLHRHATVRDRLQPRLGRITVEDVQQALTDHRAHPASVCRHLSDPPKPGEIATLASVIMDVTEGRMWVASGPPCMRPYQEYRLSTLEDINVA
jgi:isopenicillin-N N-acyltransferase-like protein